MIKAIKFILKDFKEDFLFLKDVFTGKVKLGDKTSKIIKEVGSDFKKKNFLSDFFIKNWVWILISVAFFVVGFWYGAIYYQVKFSEAVAQLSCSNSFNEMLNQTINLTIK